MALGAAFEAKFYDNETEKRHYSDIYYELLKVVLSFLSYLFVKLLELYQVKMNI